MADVPPTRMNLTTFKSKGVAAKKGYDLLKKKSDALKVRFRDIMKAIYATKVGMADVSSSAFFSLTQAEYAAGRVDFLIALSHFERFPLQGISEARFLRAV